MDDMLRMSQPPMVIVCHAFCGCMVSEETEIIAAATVGRDSGHVVELHYGKLMCC